MIYHAIGVMSGSSMDGLDVVHCTFEEIGGKWTYHINAATCFEFSKQWKNTLREITKLSGVDLLLTHTAFGKWIAEQINIFIENNNLQHKTHLIASHGHTVFHLPAQRMTWQMGDGAAIAALCKLPVVSDLRNMDIALGGQGAPIVPIADMLLWKSYKYLLNIGGICNITIQNATGIENAFDISAANRVLNILANKLGAPYDDGGNIAQSGNMHAPLYDKLNELDYYKKSIPKSLANEFGTQHIMDIIDSFDCSIEDKLHTYTHHIAYQISCVCTQEPESTQMLITGGGAFNHFLIEKIRNLIENKNIKVVVPDSDTIMYKEAIAMALIGILRWREEPNVLKESTGAERSSVGGALWMGQE